MNAMQLPLIQSNLKILPLLGRLNHSGFAFHFFEILTYVLTVIQIAR